MIWLIHQNFKIENSTKFSLNRNEVFCGKAPNRLEKKGKARKQQKKTNESRDENVEIVMETIVECSRDLTSTLTSLVIVNSLIDL